MAEHVRIVWRHHTFNPWWGCVEALARVRPLLGPPGREAIRPSGEGKGCAAPLLWRRAL
jgi:hypothetical protein